MPEIDHLDFFYDPSGEVDESLIAELPMFNKERSYV